MHADWAKAAHDYEQLTKIFPDNVSYWALLGQVCAHCCMPEKSVAACSCAIELDPDCMHPYMHRAWAYRQLKQWDSSIADYTKARELDLKYRGTMHSTKHRGQMYLEMGEYEKAAEDFTLAINGSPGWQSHYVLRGIAYMKMKRLLKMPLTVWAIFIR